jgi:hypothetical protein
MSRYTGFQSDDGVAVLDTVTGELVLYPFDGAPPRRLRPATAQDEAPRPERRPSSLPLARTGTPSISPEYTLEDGPPPEPQSAFRPARRLAQPRPMVIRYPSDEEVAMIKAARLARSGRSGTGEPDQ